MNKETYKKIGILFPVITGSSFVLGIVLNNYILPIFVVVIGVPLIIFAKSRVKDIIEDERHYKIGGYAGRYAIVLYSLIASLLGLVLIVQDSPVIEAVAHTLLASVSVLLFCYLILYAYYERKM